MPPIIVDENELLKQELSTSVAERAGELTGTAVASRMLPQFSQHTIVKAGMTSTVPSCCHAFPNAQFLRRSAQDSRAGLPPLKVQSHGKSACEAAPRAHGQMSAFHLNRNTKKIMSLPCTVVNSANGVREILDLTCALEYLHRICSRHLQS